jgi:hypothetical protein
MATRATIAVKHADGTIEQVYHHFDGYLDELGAQLVADYNSYEAAAQLVAMGDMSSIGEPYTARGEKLRISRFSNLSDFLADYQREEYNYLFANGRWYVEFVNTDSAWVTMERAQQLDS